MSWTKALGYLKHQVAKHGVESLKPEARSDDGLPFGARIGSLINLQQAAFLRASVGGSLVVGPDAGQTLIRAISHVKLDFPGDIYRYYLVTGDVDEDREKFIQVVTDEQKNVVELLYCSRFTRFVPETEEDQDAFMGTNECGLGEQIYSLLPEQMAENGYSDRQITTALAGGSQLDYVREAGNASDSWVAPFNGSEVRIDDPLGNKGIEQDIWFMPYVRQTSDSKEYLLITTQVINSKDGDGSQRAMFVDLVVGIPLDKERLTIQ